MHVLGTIAAALARYHAYKANLERLNACSEAELADMGVRRKDIADMAWEEAERRFPLPKPQPVHPLPGVDHGGH